jgi:hypothetical protein
MRKFLYCLAAIALTAGLGTASAQGANTPGVSSPDANKAETHDRPIGWVRIKLPAVGTGGGPSEPPPPPPPIEPPISPPGYEDIPPIEVPPDPPPPVEPPTYFGEPVQGKFAFLLDASGSMYGSRIQTVRAETTNVITLLTEDDEFDCVAYGSQFPSTEDYSKFMWLGLMPATDTNKVSAIAWVNGPSTNPGGGTPTYACLKKSCQLYPADLDKMFLLTDGAPNISGSASQILADFPGWWQKFELTELVAICIGGSSQAQNFMKQLAALAGGTYISA